MKALQKITSLFLAALFLLSSFGFTIGKMVCLKSGKTELSIVSIEDCCAKAKGNNVACCDEQKEESGSTFKITKSDCCDISNTALQLKDFNPSYKKNIPVAYCMELHYVNAIAGYNITSSSPSTLFFADLPPPLHGRQLLSFISVFII